MRAAVAATMETRWLGQGPRVEEFESAFRTYTGANDCVMVSSGTAALHLAYLLAGIKPGDEVVAPLFTCTATNTPLLQIGARIRFADVGYNSLNSGIGNIGDMVTEKTKAIVVVHYGGAILPHMRGIRALCDERNIVLIEDCAQALGAWRLGHKAGWWQNAGSWGDFACYSFQAVKHVTTGDGGCLRFGPKAAHLADRARRMRWFGIDRQAKLAGTWANDITELGYKYQMTDIAASMGIESLRAMPAQVIHRTAMRERYMERLEGFDGVNLIDVHPGCAAWLCTVMVEDRREDLIRKLREQEIESGQVHYRNDRYTIFAGARERKWPNMDAIEGKYLVLPLHMAMDVDDVERVCDVIKGGW
jgi:dTDP-4-amino-4,6-dideoxygalactose transaminase